MSEYNNAFSREEAVQKAAELLRNLGTAFFPLDTGKVLSVFGKQVQLFTYAALQETTGKGTAEHAIPGIDFPVISRDGFCYRITHVLLRIDGREEEVSVWYIFHDDLGRKTRIRFTLMHELGHILLNHHQRLNTNTLTGMNDDPRYQAADQQADLFSINLLAPAPAVFRLLTVHGYTYVKEKISWMMTNPEAPFLVELGHADLNPEELIMTAFGLSRSAAERRISELPAELQIWKKIDPELYAFTENIPHRSGWYCRICHTRRRTKSLYCPGCGQTHEYEYRDYGLFPKPVMGLRETGQFEFCSVCGNEDLPEDAVFCPICGNPVINECRNASEQAGFLSRWNPDHIRNPHRCRPTDIYCRTCGALTHFGVNRGPTYLYWGLSPGCDRCRALGTRYPAVLEAPNGMLEKCPVCGHTKTIRNGRYCAKCLQPMENVCDSNGKGAHSCGANDRFCRICGSETLFRKEGFLPDYRESEVFGQLMKEEPQHRKKRIRMNRILILPDGRLRVHGQDQRT